MKKEEGVIKRVIDQTLKVFNILTIFHWIYIVIVSFGSIIVEVEFLMGNPFFVFFLGVSGIAVGMAIIAIIAILAHSKKIKNLIFIEAKQPILDEICGEAIIHDERRVCYYTIKFPLHIDSKTPLSVSVKSINCNFMYKDVLVQNMRVQDGDIFATNGMKVDLVTVEGLKNNDQICPLNPFPYIPLLPESNEGWAIKGNIKFKWVSGTFEKDFNIPVPTIDSVGWKKARLENQQLYTSIFGAMEEKD